MKVGELGQDDVNTVVKGNYDLDTKSKTIKREADGDSQGGGQ